MERPFWIEIVSGIPDSLRVILDSNARDLVPRKMAKFNPGLSQILSTVFLSTNM